MTDPRVLDYATATADQPDTPVPDERTGTPMMYSSGTTGRPKVPRSIDYLDELPRLPTGKLYKRLLRDKYWAESGSKIV